MKGILRFLVLALALALLPAPALAGEFPSLVGTWKALPAGPLVKESSKESFGEADFFTGINATIVIDRQEGTLFYGQSKTPQRTVSLVGVVDEEDRTAFMVDDKGVYICRFKADPADVKKAEKDVAPAPIIGAPKPKPADLTLMVVRYLQPGEKRKVVGLITFQKQK